MPALVAAIGLAVGSFLNVVIGRLRSCETGWRSRSRCPDCKTVLRAVDLMPVLSFVLLRGRCRSCRKPISWQYPVVETATALLFLASFWIHGGLDGQLAPERWMPILRDWVFISALTVVFVIDLRDMLVFDSVTLPMIPIAFGFNWWLGYDPLNLLIATALGAGFFILQYVISRGTWIGGGDIRIGAMMGAMLGVSGTVAALFIAYILGALVAIPLLAMGKTKWSAQMAFGTFLSAATLIVLFFGRHLWQWYAALLGF